jgi:flagella basal body P-ring formation protein FlgA
MRLAPSRRSGRGARATQALRRLVLSGLLAAAFSPALAEDRMVPTPNQVIYPGDVIRDSMLTDVSVYDIPNNDGTLLDNRAALLGKVAKRTLLPGRGITALSVANPKAVKEGANVKLIYNDGGLSIVTTAMALEGGSVGDPIKVRNADSGVTLSGVIQPDGTVSVSDGS